MTPDKVIYTDGRDVTVTDSTLKVKNTSYLINGITKLSMWTIRPDRWPAVLLMLVGLAAAALAFLGMIPASWDLSFNGETIPANNIFLWTGIGLVVLSILILLSGRVRYAVRIATAEGEKNAIVSDKREYIVQIVEAMNRAFNFGHNNTTTTTYYSDQSTTIR